MPRHGKKAKAKLCYDCVHCDRIYTDGHVSCGIGYINPSATRASRCKDFKLLSLKGGTNA